MEITNASIKYFQKSGLGSVYNEGLKHIKVLPYLSVVQSIEGSYDITLGNGELKQTGEGGFFIAPAGVEQTIVHHVNKKSGKMICRWIFIEIEVNKAFSLDSLYRFPVVIKDDQKNDLNIIFDRIFETNDIWENYCDCYKLIGYLMQMATPIKNEMHQGVQLALTYITEHYAEQITVGSLAGISSMSESNFFAAFKKHTAGSPMAFLNHYRLSIAADKLSQSNMPINEISYLVGIRDPLYFSKLFKKTYGMAPKEYRMVYQG